MKFIRIGKKFPPPTIPILKIFERRGLNLLNGMADMELDFNKP